MCVTCGCGHPKKDHGDRSNLTRQDFEDAAQAAKLDMHHVVANINDAYRHGELSKGKAKPDEEKMAPYVVVRPVPSSKSGYRVLKAATRDEQRYTLGVAYAPDHPDVATALDGHRDKISPEELEQTAWHFLRNTPRIGLSHEETYRKAGEVVESYIYRGPTWEIADLTVEAGFWLLGVVWEPWAWGLIKSRRIVGFSPEGTALRR